MDRDRIIRIVVAEAEPHAGMLRAVLEREGFEVVGRASNDGELAAVLECARPSVIVLDAGISAFAAADARRHGAVIVVWPEGVAAVTAEERVDPDLVFEDLAAAVRRAAIRRGVYAARRAPDLVVLPELHEEADIDTHPLETMPPMRRSPPRRSRRTILRAPMAAAAVFVMYVIAASAFAVGVTGGLVAMSDRTERGRPTATEASSPTGDDPRNTGEIPRGGDPDGGRPPGEPNDGVGKEPIPGEEPDGGGVTTSDDGRGGLDAVGGGATGAVVAGNEDDGDQVGDDTDETAGDADDGDGDATAGHGHAGEHGSGGDAQHAGGNGKEKGGRANDGPERDEGPGGP